MNNESDSIATYEPNALPDDITRKLYVRYAISGYEAGRITIKDYNFDNGESVLLCESEITIVIPHDLDIKGLALKSLEEKKAQVLAENHQRLKAVQDKIDNLLAIEYKPEIEA